MVTNDKKILVRFVKLLYQEDSEGNKITEEKINKTINRLLNNTEAGIILMIDYKHSTIGYAILINYWSNEYGGIIVHLDELYIDPGYQGKGFATKFINYLISSRYNNAVAFQLEVMPSNHMALKFYQKVGFQLDKNKHLIYEYKE